MESTLSTLVTDKPSNPNILKTLKCVVSSVTGESTINGTKYNRKFWETILSNPRLQSLLRNKTLFGELDHPEDSRSVETQLANSAIAFTELSIEGSDVLGTFDVLNTPAGKIVDSLISAGCNIGLSIRGVGTIGYDGVVSPNNYFLHGIDVVSDPSHQPARMISSICESAKPRINNTQVILESVSSAIESAEDESKLPDITNIVERLSIDEDSKQLLNEKIEQKCDELAKGTDLENTEDPLLTLIEKVNNISIELQHVSEERDSVLNAYNQLVEKNINESAKVSETYVTVKKADLEELKQYCNSLQDTVLTLEELNKADVEKLAANQLQVEDLNQRLNESMESMGYKVGQVDSLMREKNELQSQLQEVNSQVEAYKQKHDELLKGYASQKTQKTGIVVNESYTSKQQFDRLFEKAKHSQQLNQLPSHKSTFSDPGSMSFDYIESQSELSDLANLARQF